MSTAVIILIVVIVGIAIMATRGYPTDDFDQQSRPGAAKANGNQQQTATTTSTNRSDA